MINFIHKYKLSLIGIIAGAIAGYLYYHFTGCSKTSCGTCGCSITSNPYSSSLYGGVLGGMVFNIFQKTDPQKNKNTTNE